MQLSRPAQLVPAHISNRDPSYLMVGGLVFTPCNEPYLASEYGQDYMTESPVSGRAVVRCRRVVGRRFPLRCFTHGGSKQNKLLSAARFRHVEVWYALRIKLNGPSQ